MINIVQEAAITYLVQIDIHSPRIVEGTCEKHFNRYSDMDWV